MATRREVEIKKERLFEELMATVKSLCFIVQELSNKISDLERKLEIVNLLGIRKNRLNTMMNH